MCSIVAGSISWAAWVSRDLIFTKCLMQWWASFSSTLIYFCNISTMYSTCTTTTITSNNNFNNNNNSHQSLHRNSNNYTTIIACELYGMSLFPLIVVEFAALRCRVFFYKLSLCINYAITVTYVVIVNSTWTKCRVIWDLWHDLQRQRYY